MNILKRVAYYTNEPKTFLQHRGNVLSQYFVAAVRTIAIKLKIKRKQALVRKHNKPRPRVAHRGIARFLGIDQNVIRSSHGYSTPSLKISCKSVQPFSRNLANKHTKKSIENNTPSPDLSGTG